MLSFQNQEVKIRNATATLSGADQTKVAPETLSGAAPTKVALKN